MEPNDPTITRAIATLNALLAEEPEALRELLTVRIPIRAQTVDKIPELVVRDTDPPRLTVLGLINTVMGIAHGDHAYLASIHDEVDGPVRTFGRAFPHCPKCADHAIGLLELPTSVTDEWFVPAGQEVIDEPR